MKGYRTVRLLSSLFAIGVILALLKYHEVESQVENSPYWASSPEKAREKGAFIANANVSRSRAALPMPEPKLLALWQQHSYSYVRTGLFASAVVVNPQRGLRALFDQPLLSQSMKNGWLLEVDGRPIEPTLTSDGVLVDGFVGGAEIDHSIKLTTESGKTVEWKARIPI